MHLNQIPGNDKRILVRQNADDLSTKVDFFKKIILIRYRSHLGKMFGQIITSDQDF